MSKSKQKHNHEPRSPDTLETRNSRLQKQAEEGKLAAREYAEREQAKLANMARLRALRSAGRS